MSRNDPIIPRKWKLSAHGQQNVFLWGAGERSVHTLMKAFIWALYLPEYGDLTVEVRAGDPRYKPDVVALPPEQDPFQVTVDPKFWGEAGQVGKAKIETLVRRYPGTHFAIAKWDTPLHAYARQVQAALKSVERQAPFDLLRFPPDSRERFIDEDGQITLTFDDFEWMRL